MIIVRAPLRISFVGGGTDLPDFYTKAPGRVLSAAIDKYVYVTVTKTPFRKISMRYSDAESVAHPRDLVNDRAREALLDLGITKNIEISTFSHLPGKTGLGSSSAYSVALIKALNALQGRQLTTQECAEGACRLEIELVKDPIGKQDQYASSYGGINEFRFNRDHSVDIEPVHLDFKHRIDFERHLVLFFTGVTRDAKSVLSEQRKNTSKARHFQTLKKMAGSVSDFRKALEAGDFKTIGNLLHAGWLQKKTLASNISNPLIDELYNTGRGAEAWGGKVLGAGGGGCLLFVVPPEKNKQVQRALSAIAKKRALYDAAVIPFSFVQSGGEVIIHSED